MAFIALNDQFYDKLRSFIEIHVTIANVRFIEKSRNNFKDSRYLESTIRSDIKNSSERIISTATVLTTQ